MSISQHIHTLREHLARLGLQPVPDQESGSQEVFKICFLNKVEMQRWKELKEKEKSTTNHNIIEGEQ
ncbi:hypothetical protein [Chitinophaga sp. Cy-1792]|uniref:hypothetical protein n=1 Tax=Chitinophaga sp. Cy-1792 TaxID=2608339 RepID=UPI001421CD15|nr:hypothetical protein [Chitinophaga sp. Cy-1792]NIG52266.1 hypothetical protein [Chitinophaga sp. Cy-1792]